MTKILAIDDSKTMRLAIKITFAAEPVEVVAVSKGSEAVARAKQMGANIVLVDHTLAPSEPSGFDVVRAIRADPATASTPVLMLMPSRGTVDEAAVEASGADGYIGKPFDSQALIDKVNALVGRPSTARPAAQAAPAARPAVPAPAARPAAPAPAARPAAPAPAARPAVPAPAARPAVPVPAARPAAPAAAVPPLTRPAAVPPLGRGPGAAAAPAAAPAAASRPVAAKPVAASPAAVPSPSAGAARPPSGPAAAPAQGAIPIAVPIPFASADAPTPGMLRRLAEAGASGGAAAGLDPAAVKALLALSREVVEQVVWEVVPELAEQVIREKAGQ